MFCNSYTFLRETGFTEEDIQVLGELGVVAIVAFESLERSDTGNYMCNAENSLPGQPTGILMAIPAIIPLTVLGWWRIISGSAFL